MEVVIRKWLLKIDLALINLCAHTQADLKDFKIWNLQIGLKKEEENKPDKKNL